MFQKDMPVFEIGPKLYTYGRESVKIAQYADELAEKYRVQIIYSAQYLDIEPIARTTKNLFVFAQHVDGVAPGRGIGKILPEVVKEAGAVGTLLNHAEYPLTLSQLQQSIARCHQVGLTTLVCGESVEQCMAALALGADAVLQERSDQIGMGSGIVHDAAQAAQDDDEIRRRYGDVLVFHGAGIRDERDVYNIIYAGARATGVTSAVFANPDPYAAMKKIIQAVRAAWDDRYGK